MRRRRRTAAQLVCALAMLPFALMGCGGGDSVEDEFKRALEESVREAGDIDRRYSDEDIEELVDDFIHGLNADARYRTPAERRAAEEELDRWLSSEAGQVDRLQHLFELSVEMQMLL